MPIQQGSDFQIGNYRFLNVFPGDIAGIIAWVNSQPARATVGEFYWNGSAGVPTSPQLGDVAGGGATAVPELTREARERIIEQEKRGLEPSFDQYLAQLPAYQRMGGLGRSALESRYNPAVTSYQLEGGQYNPVQPQTFYEFLQKGGGMLNPGQMRAALTRIGGYGGQTGLTEEQAGQRAYFATEPAANQRAYQAALTALTQGVHPLFRGAATSLAQQAYDLFSSGGEASPFIDWLARRGGRFYG